MLVDVHLGGGCGLELTRALVRGEPTLPVLLVSSDPLDHRVEECGARGFVLKSELARTDLTAFWPA